MEPKIITTKTELEVILNQEKCFLFPVLNESQQHYLNNSISFVYGFTIHSQIEFLVGFNHYDIPSIDCDVGQINAELAHICYKKKYLPFYKKLIDAELLNWLVHNTGLEFPSNNCIDFFHRTNQPNSIIPIYKWIELIREIKNTIIRLRLPPVDVIDNYNNILNQLIQIEHAGLYTINHSRNFSSIDGQSVEYTEYNLCTTTGRPSNKFGGINYAALNKNDGSRRRFISRFDGGWLIEFDYEAFHVNLIGKILQYTFTENPYIYLSKMFFNTLQPTELEIMSAKELTFQQLYGGIRSEYKHIDFFQKLDRLLRDIEKQNSAGILKSFLFEKPMPSTDNHIKSFNHLLQNLETEMNSVILTKLNGLLESYRSKLILYTYDSFLFDYCPDDGIHVIKKIKSIIDSIGINSRICIGKNYQAMRYKK